jgi:xylulokinase
MLAAPLYDPGARDWCGETCERLGIPRRLLPRPARAHDVAGSVTTEAALATGLPRGLPVVAGGGDFAAATLGAGVVEEGEACLMLGTAGNLLMPLRRAGTDTRLINSHHVGADRYLSLGGTLAGAVQEWFRRAIAPEATFAALDAEAARVEPGAAGLLMLPYLQGERTPLWNSRARGAFLGLGLGHGRGHLYRALLEGVALSFRHCQEVVAAHGVTLAEVVAVNGGGRSELWRQILADVLGVPLLYAPHCAGTVAGAAVLAGLGIGALPSADVARRWRGPVVRHAPDASAHARYEDLFRLRRDAYDGLSGWFDAVHAFATER